MPPEQKKSSPWLWLFLIVVVCATSQCTIEDNRLKAAKEEREAADLKNWQDSPEFAFRFCITTVAGEHGTATPEQIEACNKVAGR